MEYQIIQTLVLALYFLLTAHFYSFIHDTKIICIHHKNLQTTTIKTTRIFRQQLWPTNIKCAHNKIDTQSYATKLTFHDYNTF